MLDASKGVAESVFQEKLAKAAESLKAMYLCCSCAVVPDPGSMRYITAGVDFTPTCAS